ncbi:BON domain-containing protein [Burkholderia glumae]|uniref:BON domain-containing protein n=1 Tax=Burkholderia glumae TaxID=337 RepID=A0AAQ0BQM8_BURGL|nr:BON domain-containing protein [Burkholderia glumae]ACR32366.1 Transport-associated protein [Burkholderia glumae BGR1]AJY63743.1 BON domain protein [Burkholderia glumae LMG 2196 = ATCC 33617]MCM2484437.1 BON domain-containing protein [Burkholderia glumae]MCM2494807.1 BON domain-containing protein [Burkholderia glumae]MCM2510129.1 BON domain-containing protein [Burkholderia glumae]
MKTDIQLKKDIESELAWDPSIDAARIGVAVHDRIVTLSGEVPSYLGKITLRKAVERIAEVRGVVLDLTVRTAGRAQRTDADIAAAARAVLAWDAALGEQAVHVTVERGRVTLSGDVDGAHQMQAAERAVERLSGVTHVNNEIRVRRHPAQSDVAAKIAAAMTRHAADVAGKVAVTIQDGRVTLTGRVDSLRELQLARNAAWSAPGVREVVDQLSVA